jgi:hypothetical protein
MVEWRECDTCVHQEPHLYPFYFSIGVWRCLSATSKDLVIWVFASHDMEFHVRFVC